MVCVVVFVKFRQSDAACCALCVVSLCRLGCVVCWLFSFGWCVSVVRFLACYLVCVCCVMFFLDVC